MVGEKIVLRAMSCKQDMSATASGSCLFTAGNTKVCCVVTGPSESTIRDENVDNAVIYVSIKGFETSFIIYVIKGEENKRIESFVYDVLAAVLITSKLPSTFIDFQIRILEDDGSVLVKFASQENLHF
ncbi:exosome non-catalytic core subunit rrp46 [Bonamia ostreae]|uniref:Exosome non-catalytic core subunit rrp46 n=1 Tax=Bonamia ostreae TaxID=126728 RepID=A0ABV2AKN3_9EUKA